MNKSLKNVLALSLISAIVAILMAITNHITAPIIEKNQSLKQNEALLEVLPDAESFEPVDLSAYTIPATITAAYKANNGGYAITVTTSGYASGLVIMCGINANGEVVSATVIANAETPSIAGDVLANYGSAIAGATADSIDSIDAMSSATAKLTKNGYKNGVKDALIAAQVFMGGSYDSRTEEEILIDNMTALLPAANGAFSRVFITEAIDSSIVKVYSADNGEGYVFVFAENKIIAFAKDGSVLGEASDEEKTLVSENAAILAASTSTVLDTTELGLHKNVKKVELTASGNYIFTVNAVGFTYDDHYFGMSPDTPIVIRIAMTAEGKILDCDTVSQKESEKYGAACEKDAFTDQFIGKDSDSYREIDGISGATITTDGYLSGIKRAYDALAILTAQAGGEAQ